MVTLAGGVLLAGHLSTQQGSPAGCLTSYPVLGAMLRVLTPNPSQQHAGLSGTNPRRCTNKQLTTSRRGHSCACRKGTGADSSGTSGCPGSHHGRASSAA